MPNSGVHTWASKMRQPMNFILYDKLALQGRRQEFHRAFEQWKMLGQTARRKYKACVPVRKKTRDFVNMVYRTGEHNTTDFDAYLPKNTSKSTQLDTELRMKSDYIKKAMQIEDRSTFTLPVVMEPVDMPEDTSDAAAAAMVESSAQGLFKSFRILEKDPARFKYHCNQDAFDSMICPMMLQTLRPWQVLEESSSSYPLSSFTMCELDDPDLEDLLNMSSWQCIRYGLRSWQVDPLAYVPIQGWVQGWVRRICIHITSSR